MTMTVSRRTTAVLILAATILTSGEALAQAPQTLLDGIAYREIGPTRQSGRFVEFAVPLSTPQVFYAATASGGLWKTENRGLTFTSLLDDTGIISLGAVAVSQSEPDVVWVGTGEGNNSRSNYYGDGVYKSTNGGSSWTNMGLKESHHISRIVIDPKNADVVYVAANGHLYSENEERGLYKTTNGGKSWTKVLDVQSEGHAIGVTDIAMDPKNSSVLYATAYDKVRRPWTFNEGGPGSGIYKSTNAGRSWTQLEKGLPTGMLGRIGLAVYPKDPKILYAIIENANSEGVPDEVRRQELLEGKPPSERPIGVEIYRSDNAGSTWKKVNEEGRPGGDPPYYYAQIRISSDNPDLVYNLGASMAQSNDGGKTWRGGFRFGGDNHALWIDPDDSRHMLLGYDHGMGVTYDGGQNWYHPDDLPLAQLYAVGYDMAYPYNVYGGLQDNGSWRGPSAVPGRGGIGFENWFRVGGGDGMYNEVDPVNGFLYNESQFGPITRTDQRTGQSRSIRYRAEGLRFNWAAPILVSPHDSDVVYHGANKLLRSEWRGESWKEVSPDLTTNDPAKIQGTGNIQYCTITTLDESPIVPGVLWVGTDDGNLQMSPDGGENWTLLNGNVPDWPNYWVSRVVASYHDTATAYVTVTGLRRDDFRPFVWKTADNGTTWTSISNGLPSNESVNVIREDQENPNLLFVGTDRAVYVSLDAGAHWQSMRNGMPAVPIHDLKIHPREKDLIVGTHGRGVFIADITALEEATPQVIASTAHLFEIETAVRWQDPHSRAASSQNFSGENESSNAVIRYWLGQDAKNVRVKVYAGIRLIRDLEGDLEAGLNQVAWDLRGERPRTPEERRQYAQRQRQRQGGGGGGGGGFPQGGFGGRGGQENPDTVLVDMPYGTYRVVLVVDGKEYTGSATIMQDFWWQDRP